MTKRIVLSDNGLLRKTHPVLLDIFSRGVLETQSQRLVQAAFIAMVISGKLRVACSVQAYRGVEMIATVQSSMWGQSKQHLER